MHNEIHSDESVDIVFMWRYYNNGWRSKITIGSQCTQWKRINSKYSFHKCTHFFQWPMISSLMLRSLIHCELTLVQGGRHGSSFSFLHADFQFSWQHLLKRLSFLHHTFLATLSTIITVDLYLGPLFCSTGLCICFLFIYFFCQYHDVFIAMLCV
jgi:hypothetical protein